MKTAKFLRGDAVRVDSGVYAGAEGVIDDIQPECSAVRIHTKSGNAYAFLDAVSKLVKPMPVNKPALRKR
jgi:hypothetical protein